VSLSNDEIQLLGEGAPDIDGIIDRASQNDPDRYARALDVAKESSLPLPAVEGEVDELERRRRVQGIDTSSFGPQLRSYVGNIDRATVSIDDLDNLAATEDGFWRRRWNDARRGGNQLLRGLTTSQIENSQTLLNAYNVVETLPDKDLRIVDKISGQISEQFMGQYLRGTPEDRLRLKGRENPESSWRLPLYDFVDAHPEINFSDFADPGIQSFIRAGAEQRSQSLKRAQERKTKGVTRMVQQTADIASIPVGQRRQAFDEAKGFGEAFGAFLDAPTEVATSLTTESLVQFAPAIPFAFLGPEVGAIMAGATSFGNEYAGDITGSMIEAGVDLTSEDSILNAFTDPVKFNEWRQHAQDRSVPIAFIDALSMGVAGKLTAAAKTTKGKIAAGAGEALALQPALGGAGEVAGALTAGDEIEGQAVLAEMLGEIAPGAVETAIGSYNINKQAKTVKRINKVVDSIEDQQALDDFIVLAQSSTTNKRAREIYKEFLAKAGEDQVIYVPADIVTQLEEIPEFMAEQIDGLGADIEIPMSLFMSDIAPNDDMLSILRPHLKMNEDLMSASEIEEGGDETVKNALRNAQQAVDEKTESDEIESVIYEQLKATGRATDSEARINATLYSARAREAAKRYGITPMEVFERMGATVTGPAQAQPGEPSIVMTQDFGDLKITEEVEVEGTGKTVTVTQPAQRVFDRVAKRRNVMQKLKDCLES
tara:strand:+ start:15385 stop:17520 length:2136 start_codon:yes stop_codon:yes gene_type:complete